MTLDDTDATLTQVIDEWRQTAERALDFAQEVATVSVSGQGIPLSAFPKTELDPDKPLVIDRRNGTRRQDCDHIDPPVRVDRPLSHP